jgi:hypothetical protein
MARASSAAYSLVGRTHVFLYLTVQRTPPDIAAECRACLMHFSCISLGFPFRLGFSLIRHQLVLRHAWPAMGVVGRMHGLLRLVGMPGDATR